MSNLIQITPEEAWQHYKHIEGLIGTARDLKVISSNNYFVDYALQRLCLAVLKTYNLTREDHFEFLSNLTISVDVDKPNLSTIKEMFNARICQWESAVQSESAGSVSHGDVIYTTGRDAGYRPRLSIAQVLNWDYDDFEARVNVTPQTAWKTYKAIEDDVQAKCRNETDKNRVQKMERALNRLCQAVLNKYKLEKPADHVTINIETPSLHSNTIYSTHSMLNAKVKVWEDAIPRFSFNYYHLDYFFTGREAGYQPKASLAEVLRK